MVGVGNTLESSSFGKVALEELMKRWTRKRLTTAAALCLELGAGLLENGAETSRVEETIRLTGVAFDMEVEAMVHPTGITVSFGDGESITKVARIKERVVNLDKVAELNRVSRELLQDPTDLDGFRKSVHSIRSAPGLYSTSQMMLSTAVSCACLTLVVGGGVGEALVALLAGCLSRVGLDKFGSGFPSFLSLFAVGLVSTIFGLLGASFYGLSTEFIVVGSLLYQMPGLAFVSAMRDLMAGELVAGNARLSEAILVTLGMASGVIAGLSFAVRLGWETGV